MTARISVANAASRARLAARQDRQGIVAAKLLIFIGLIVATLVLDHRVQPRSGSHERGSVHSFAGMCLHALIITAVFGVVLAICGHVLASALLALALMALFTMVSNAKRAMLGEPLVFSDLALIGAVFQHPQFYMSALGGSQKAVLALLAMLVPGLLWWLFVPLLLPHLLGIALALGALGLLAVLLRSALCDRLGRAPDAPADVERHGLLATLLLYCVRWRETVDPPACPPIKRHGQAAPDTPQIAIIIQCESFADPVDLFSDAALQLPGLAKARSVAWQSGNLEVCGFGAYTMRTEYGVLFGRSEDQLGFRRFDPFLTALGEASYAMSARLSALGWRSLFVHPHDMRFYNRDQIMHAAGFAELVGQERFDPPAPGGGRYVSDAAMAALIVQLGQEAQQSTLLYAVTIENHGPWSGSAGDQPEALRQGYLRLVGNSDAMLTTLMDSLAALRKPALLAFFGDHRPSIPGVSMPGGARSTPYVIMRTDAAGQFMERPHNPQDMTPAELHHAIMKLLAGV